MTLYTRSTRFFFFVTLQVTDFWKRGVEHTYAFVVDAAGMKLVRDFVRRTGFTKVPVGLVYRI